MRPLVIGAGIAGLSAAWHLGQAGLEAIVLEARDRIGGRVWTNRDFADIPIEFGAELIHGCSDEVNTWEWVRQLGLKTWHWQKTADSMIRMEDGRWLTMQAARAASAELDATRSWELGDAPAPDENEDLATYLKRVGFNETQLRYVQRSFANAEGDNMEFLNAKAHAHLFVDRGGEGDYGDYRILDGYDSYYEKLAEGLDIRLNAAVRTIDWSAGVMVTTADGRTFAGEEAVITLPVGVLKADRVRFIPDLPAVKQAALAGLQMGPVMKMVYEFESPILDAAIGAIYARGNPPMWWSPSLGREQGAVVWTAFFSGDYARDMLELGEEGALQQGLKTLRREIGNPDLAYKQARWVNWPRDEFSLGGYSVCLPGHYGARAKLAQASPPLYWAGEATAAHHLAAMVHGAYASGQRAAHEIVAGRRAANERYSHGGGGGLDVAD